MKNHIVLIHGTWCNGDVWGDFATKLEQLGFVVHTPSLRYHDLPYDECFKLVGDVSITDYVNDLVMYIEQLSIEPIILGHSLGGLLAQLVASRVNHKGLILMGTAPTADIFAFYPTMVKSFLKHFLRWGFWKKAMPPYKKEFIKYCLNEQEEDGKEALFNTLIPESGLVYTQMAFPMFDKNKSTVVDYSKINGPVLVLTGSKDKMVHPNIAKATAKHYKNSILVSITGSDHMYEYGKYQNKTIDIIKYWAIANRLI